VVFRGAHTLDGGELTAAASEVTYVRESSHRSGTDGPQHLRVFGREVMYAGKPTVGTPWERWYQFSAALPRVASAWLGVSPSAAAVSAKRQARGGCLG
jgi:hypothetical protein